MPSVLFNEKVMAGLGQDLGADGVLDDAAMARALVALKRFRQLATHLKLTRIQTVATAAVRDARNGGAFLREVAALGFEPLLVPGVEEARLAGFGVLSGIPSARGIAGDLGGGSLELVVVGDKTVGEAVSLPLGVLRLDPDNLQVPALAATIAQVVMGTSIERAGQGRPLYLVGGSWRSLALIDMHFSGHPLPILHQHRIEPGRIAELGALIASADRAVLKTIGSLSGSRIPTLPAAAALLQALAQTLHPDALVTCAYGLREGLLYRELTPDQRQQDPLLAAAREIGGRYGRFDDHGDLLDRWIAPVFADDDASARRLRLAACLLADVAWGAHPDFRAERAFDMAVHGNWVGIDAAGRAMLGLALFSAFGGTQGFNPAIAALCTDQDRCRAQHWGLAIRLAQRLSGGVAAPLKMSRLERDADCLRLRLASDAPSLAGEAVLRRLKQLGIAIGIETRMA